MAISSVEAPDGKRVTIEISGRFDFGAHQDFSKVFRQYPRGGRAFVVDLSNTDYMDSSALGMLLQLRDYSDRAAGGVTLANSNAGIREILRIANFEKLFTIT